MYNIMIIIMFSILTLSGCSVKEKNKVAKTPFEASDMASYELSYMKRDYEKFLSEKIEDSFKNLYMPASRNILTNKTVAVTSMVNVNDFTQTSNFGRLFADLMITDLERVGWDVVDVRGKTIKIQEKNGEFFLNRKDIKKFPSNSIVLVGTYSNYKEGLILNIRLIDPEFNKLLSSTNLYLDDEESFNMANQTHCLDIGCKEKKKEDSYLVKIIEDDCVDANGCKE